MGALTAQRATSWRMGDVCRAVVSAITLTTLQSMDINPAKSKWIHTSSPAFSYRVPYLTAFINNMKLRIINGKIRFKHLPMDTALKL